MQNSENMVANSSFIQYKKYSLSSCKGVVDETFKDVVDIYVHDFQIFQ